MISSTKNETGTAFLSDLDAGVIVKVTRTLNLMSPMPYLPVSYPYVFTIKNGAEKQESKAQAKTRGRFPPDAVKPDFRHKPFCAVFLTFAGAAFMARVCPLFAHGVPVARVGWVVG